MIINRNMLCIKNRETISLDELILWKPYKNILLNFIKLCTDKNAKVFDPIARVYDGLESVPPELEDYYESLLGVTSYFQASKGGRGRYIEQKFASLNSFSSLDIELSEIPFYLENPELHKKKGMFTLRGLNSSERRLIRNSRWSWQGETDITLDLVNIIKDENALVFIELKNRVDSGGVAARREIWLSKFRKFLEIFERDNEVYSESELFNVKKKYKLHELLDAFGISRVELYVAILFNLDGSPATREGDRSAGGFYSANKEGYRDILSYINSQESIFEIVERDEDNLRLEVIVKTAENFSLVIEALYGIQIPQKLFRKDYPVSELLLLEYDDIWLSQLLSIDERTFLLKYNKNFMVIFKRLIKRDFQVRQLYNNFISKEGTLEYLEELVTYLIEEHDEEFEDRLAPNEVTKEQYLADVIQVLASAEA